VLQSALGPLANDHLIASWLLLRLFESGAPALSFAFREYLGDVIAAVIETKLTGRIPAGVEPRTEHVLPDNPFTLFRKIAKTLLPEWAGTASRQTARASPQSGSTAGVSRPSTLSLTPSLPKIVGRDKFGPIFWWLRPTAPLCQIALS